MSEEKSKLPFAEAMAEHSQFMAGYLASRIEMLAAAWLKETGLKASEAEIVYEHGPHQTRIYVTNRKIR